MKEEEEERKKKEEEERKSQEQHIFNKNAKKVEAKEDIPLEGEARKSDEEETERKDKKQDDERKEKTKTVDIKKNKRRMRHNNKNTSINDHALDEFHSSAKSESQHYYKKTITLPQGVNITSIQLSINRWKEINISEEERRNRAFTFVFKSAYPNEVQFICKEGREHTLISRYKVIDNGKYLNNVVRLTKNDIISQEEFNTFLSQNKDKIFHNPSVKTNKQTRKKYRI